MTFDEKYNYRNLERVKFSTLEGKTLVDLQVYKGEFNVPDHIIYVTSDRERYIQFHQQDCCESVHVESIVGDTDDMLGTKILRAEEVSNSPERGDLDGDTSTWTFYKLVSAKGYLDIRWYGTSNGYYSESVDTYKVIASRH